MSNLQLRSALSSAFKRFALHYPRSQFAKNAGALLDEWERELNGLWLDAIDPAVSSWLKRSEYPPTMAEFAREVRQLMPKHEPIERRREPACLTCGRETEELVLAVPLLSQSGMPRLFCRCEISRGHALYPDEWERLQRARSAPTSHAA